MSWLSDFLGDSGTTSSTDVNAFDSLPQEFKDLLIAQANAGKNSTQDIETLRNAFEDPDRAIAPLNSVEQAGLNRVEGDSAAAAGIGDQGVGALDQIDPTVAAMRGVDVDAFVPGYENPYIDDVVGTTLARMDEDLARRQLLEESRAAQIGGTTNSRRAVAQAVDTQLTEREKAAAEAAMRSEGFWGARDRALARGEFEVGRQQGVGDMLTSQATGYETAAGGRSARGIAEGGYLQTYGEKLRGIDQARIDAPKDALTWQAGVTGDIDMPESRTQTVSNSGGNNWGQMAGGALAAYQVLSDERAKTDIAPLSGGDALDFVRGMRPSTYEYKEGHGQKTGQTAGLMAQDLERIPGAVAEGGDGYKRVDPYPVLATLAAAVQELDRRVI